MPKVVLFCHLKLPPFLEKKKRIEMGGEVHGKIRRCPQDFYHLKGFEITGLSRRKSFSGKACILFSV